MSSQRDQEFIAERTRLLECIKELEAENSIEKSELIKPVVNYVEVSAPNHSTTIPAKTFVMLRIKK